MILPLPCRQALYRAEVRFTAGHAFVLCEVRTGATVSAVEAIIRVCFAHQAQAPRMAAMASLVVEPMALAPHALGHHWQSWLSLASGNERSQALPVSKSPQR